MDKSANLGVKKMKSTGIIRKVDELGRIVLPKEMRTTFDIKERDPIEIFVEGDNIILKKYNPTASLPITVITDFISIPPNKKIRTAMIISQSSSVFKS